jgi:hypothetical protein
VSDESIDARIHKAIEALFDASHWFSVKDYEQAWAAVEEARGVLYSVEEELDVMATNEEPTPAGGPDNG